MEIGLFGRKEFMSSRKARGKLRGILRIAFVAITVICQLALLIFLIYWLQGYSSFVSLAMDLLALMAVLFLLHSQDSPSYKLSWMLLIMFLPLVGVALYLLWGRAGFRRKAWKRNQQAVRDGTMQLKQDPAVCEELISQHPEQYRKTQYLQKCGFPVYKGTDCEFYAQGEYWWTSLMTELEKAEKFIFIEMFIIGSGKVWDSVFKILQRKASQGVEVRLLYDDIGCVITLPNDFEKQIKSAGIRVLAFNKVNHYISSLYLNYRNHQKIVVIDGNVGFTGGTNLADEYANLFQKHGHWKDTCIRLRGDAVWSLTVTFLQMWNMTAKPLEYDFLKYVPTQSYQDEGFFQPISDGPENNPDNPAMDLYKLMVSRAQEYCYFTSPYLVLDVDMIDALCISARSGVDVRIIVPFIHDHWYVHMITRSHYGRLLAAGIRIYEYKPGYIHAKMVVSDDESAVIGSVNMDFRSFFLHYENAVWTCGSPLVDEIYADILETLALSEEILYEDWIRRPWYIKATQVILSVFAPMM